LRPELMTLPRKGMKRAQRAARRSSPRERATRLLLDSRFRGKEQSSLAGLPQSNRTLRYILSG
jgi:hypothetical protein